MDVPQVVNVVATGELPVRVNYEVVIERVSVPFVRYDPSIHQGLEIRLVDEGPLITMYNTGKYIIRANSTKKLYDTRKSFLRLMVEIGLIDSPHDEEFIINNIVSTGDLDRELDLDILSSDLTQGEVDYNPDQFPGIHYKPHEYSCSVLIFRSGKIIITAAPDIDTSNSAFKTVKMEIYDLFSSE